MKQTGTIYEVTEDGWLDGTYRKQGDAVPLTDQQAKWLLLAGRIKPKAAAKPDAKPKPAVKPESKAPPAAAATPKEK